MSQKQMNESEKPENKMLSKIILSQPGEMVIEWEKPGLGFGQLNLWVSGNNDGTVFIDTENMDIDHVIEVIKALP